MSHFKICLVFCGILLMSNPISQASIIIDAGFEDPNSNSNSTMGFTLTGDADADVLTPEIDPAIEGMESLRLVGNGDPTGMARFSQAFQDVPVDGVTISVGNQVVLTGDLAQLSGDPLTEDNRAFLEIAFVDSAGAVFQGQGAFLSAVIDSASPVDSFQSLATAAAIVPAGAAQVRVLAVFDEQTVNSGVNSGAVFVDNLELVVTVPEPGSAAVLAAALVMIFARRRR